MGQATGALRLVRFLPVIDLSEATATADTKRMRLEEVVGYLLGQSLSDGRQAQRPAPKGSVTDHLLFPAHEHVERDTNERPRRGVARRGRIRQLDGGERDAGAPARLGGDLSKPYLTGSNLIRKRTVAGSRDLFLTQTIHSPPS